MERETERENQHGQLQPLWGSSQAFSMENSNRTAAAAGSEKKWKIWIRQFDNGQAARELIKNAPALREKLGIERVARYRHYLIAVFPNIFSISRLFFSPSKPLRYFPLIICHVSMQISIHWLRTADIGYFRQLKIENCQLEFARSRLSNPPRKVANCTAHPPCKCHPFFHHPYPHIFSRYFLLNFYGNLQWTRRAFGIVAVIPGPTQFLMANNCQKVVRATRCGVRRRCGVGFPARKFACSVVQLESWCDLRGYVKNEKCNLLDIATGLVTSEGVSLPPTTRSENFCNICQILYANLSVAAIKCNGIITCSSALPNLPPHPYQRLHLVLVYIFSLY